jgi:hypothetical protein
VSELSAENLNAPVNPAQEQTVFAITTAVSELLESVESLSLETNANATLRINAEQTILGFIAAVIVADRRFSHSEEELLSTLLSFSEKHAGSQARYLTGYAAKWHESRKVVPLFLRCARRHDQESGTDMVGLILRELQLIGNNVSICSQGRSKQAERLVREYIGFLRKEVDRVV